jgi:hypothetical protein
VCDNSWELMLEMVVLNSEVLSAYMDVLHILPCL